MRFLFLTIAVVLATVHSIFAQDANFKGANFKKADSVANLYEGHSLSNLPLLAIKLTAPLSTDVEKFRALYTWTCQNIENDYLLYNKNQKQRAKLKDADMRKKWNDSFSKEVFETLRKRKRTICTGYAYLLRELSSHAGIECEIVDGYGRTVNANIGEPGVPNHSWNAVQLNNQWYLCDATWSSGSINLLEKEFIKNYDDCYFLASPELFIRNHYPLDTARALLTHMPTLNEFLNAPLIYNPLYSFTITALHPDTFKLVVPKKKAVRFTLASPDSTHTFKVIDILSTKTSTRPEVQYVNGTYQFDYAFPTKGLHTFHILLDDKYVATYSVKVN